MTQNAMNHELNRLGADLELKDVSVTFRVIRGFKRIEVPAVKQCSLRVGSGETVALIGESGSGKTTITNAILGLAKISSGSISFAGNAICDAGAGRHRASHQPGIQVVMQDPMSSFNPRYRIIDSLAIPLKMSGVKGSAELRSRLESLAARVGINAAMLEKYPHQLSGGQLQRLSIARAVSVQPRLIIADEPASKLDVSVRAQVLNLLKDLIEETSSSLLLITHDLDVAKFLCAKVAIMHFGVMLETGDLKQVFADPQHEYTRTLLAGTHRVADAVDA